jgi:hypothetical protein
LPKIVFRSFVLIAALQVTPQSLQNYKRPMLVSPKTMPMPII